MNLDDLVGRIRSEEEALLYLSALGFIASDWPTLNKLGTAKSLLESDLFVNALNATVKAHPALENKLKNLRPLLDNFYEQSGSLLSPLQAAHSRLFRAAKAPLVFFVRFNHRLLDKLPAVAIVGARAASEEGQAQSFELASQIAAQGINVVSGGASGVDTAAHRGALKAQGATVIITGVKCSLQSDEFYERLKEKYSEHCAVLYPFGPFFAQEKYMFVERNRFVVAMADALIVVQGQRGSGTLHTVKYAKKLGLPIFAVPGAVKNPLSWVPNALLATGEARALTDFTQDFSGLLGAKVSKRPRKHVSTRALPKAGKSAAETPDIPELMQLFIANGRALSMPELIAKTNRTFLQLQKELLSYELKGLIVKRGPQFVLTDN